MNVRVNLNYPIYDGAEIVFKAPCGASKVTGLIVYYPGNGGTVSTVFAFADAHANDLRNLDALFAEGAVVKVILDTDTNMAFVQNAATNGYIESRFASIGTGGGGGGGMVKNAVLYTEQDLSEKEQAQARRNIGAAADCGLEQPVWGHRNLEETEEEVRYGIPTDFEDFYDTLYFIPLTEDEFRYVTKYEVGYDNPGGEDGPFWEWADEPFSYDKEHGGLLSLRENRATLRIPKKEFVQIPGEYTGLGDVAAALDHIIALQEAVIG